EHRILEGILDSREGQGGRVVLGGRVFRHTLYNSRVGTAATRRALRGVMADRPFPGRSPNRNNSMQMPRIVPPNLRRRALVQSSFIHSILCKPNGFLPKG